MVKAFLLVILRVKMVPWERLRGGQSQISYWLLPWVAVTRRFCALMLPFLTSDLLFTHSFVHSLTHSSNQEPPLCQASAKSGYQFSLSPRVPSGKREAGMTPLKCRIRYPSEQRGVSSILRAVWILGQGGELGRARVAPDGTGVDRLGQVPEQGSAIMLQEGQGDKDPGGTCLVCPTSWLCVAGHLCALDFPSVKWEKWYYLLLGWDEK